MSASSDRGAATGPALGGDRSFPPATITAYPDGPYVIRGAFELRSEQGEAIPLRRPAVALCRCGKSRIRPFCDGTHRVIGFRAAGDRPGGRHAAGPS